MPVPLLLRLMRFARCPWIHVRSQRSHWPLHFPQPPVAHRRINHLAGSSRKVAHSSLRCSTNRNVNLADLALNDRQSFVSSSHLSCFAECLQASAEAHAGETGEDDAKTIDDYPVIGNGVRRSLGTNSDQGKCFLRLFL